MRAHPYRLRERKLTVHWSDCAPSQPYYAPFAPPHVRSSRATRSDSHSSSVILSLLPPLQGPRSCSAHLACRSALASSASASRSWPPQIVTAGTSAACAGIFTPRAPSARTAATAALFIRLYSYVFMNFSFCQTKEFSDPLPAPIARCTARPRGVAAPVIRPAAMQDEWVTG